MLKFQAWQKWLIILVCLLGPIYALPNVLSENQREWMAANLPSFAPSQAMSLGLDLQGGSHLQLQVDMETVIADRLESLSMASRTVLKDIDVSVTRFQIKEDGVHLILPNDADKAAVIESLKKEFGFAVNVASVDDGVTLAYTTQELANFKRQAVSQSIEIIRRRVDETGTKEPSIQASGDDRIIVQLPGMKDPDRVKDLIGKTARLTFHLVDTNVAPSECAIGRAPLGVRCLKYNDAQEMPVAVQRRVLITGDMLMDAQPGYDQFGRSVVNFRFDSLGARKFADITRQNVNRPFAIVLDDVVVTAPNINEPIVGGSGQISGNFTVQSANDLAILLRAGALPAPLKIVEERTVGPSLGADSIDSGKIASIVGTLFVMAFMIAVYGVRFGMFANIALVANVLLMLAILSIIGATLTLPGIVGIVLTIGMAVDANVLIFERIREEMRAGRGMMASIDHGFQGAMSSIVDANVTTLIAGVVLYAIGTGPVRGFAVTLSIGILTSMFGSIYVTRLLIATWVKWNKSKTLPI